MGKIVLEYFNEGDGYYKVNLAYLSKEQVEEIEDLVSKWKPTDEDIKACIGMCLTDANEQRFKDYGTNLRDCLAWLENQAPKNKTILGKTIEEVDVWLEKQGKGNKHQFKVGDFIVNDYCMGKVIELTDDAYLLDTEQGIPFSCEHNAHLWTIQDAKDGDVLAGGDWVFIFKELEFHTNGFPKCYCHYDLTLNSFKVDTNSYMAGGGDNYPATKEQRNLLFQEMRKAGYEWDADKKELKKIEKPEEKSVDKLKVSDELYEHIRNTCAWIDDALSSTTVADITDYLEMASQNAQSAFDMIEKQGGQKNKTVLDKAIEEEINTWVKKQIPKWTEEDEHHWMMCLECVEECATQKREDFSKTVDWLKSIKQSVEGEKSKDNNKIIWLEDTGKMTKEDYMCLPKERLAEMLVAKNNEPTVINVPFQSPQLQCYEPGGICTNPFRDCINCPRVFGDQSYTITTSQTILKDEK